jgi:hypothetical protein
MEGKMSGWCVEYVHMGVGVPVRTPEVASMEEAMTVAKGRDNRGHRVLRILGPNGEVVEW